MTGLRAAVASSYCSQMINEACERFNPLPYPLETDYCVTTLKTVVNNDIRLVLCALRQVFDALFII